jgi:hypothetical protein
MFVLDTTLSRVFALGISGEKSAMVFFKVVIAMPSRSEHLFYIELEPCILRVATYRDVAVRFLTADTHPDHDTICAFRRKNLPAISKAFGEILQRASEMGLLKIGKVSTDGTRIKGSDSIN